MYGYAGEAHPMFVYEQLTGGTFKLFKEAKKLKRFGVKYLWIANGEILVRERERAKVHNIKSQLQLTELEIDLTTRKNNVHEKKTTGRVDRNSSEVSGRESKLAFGIATTEIVK